MKSKTSRKIQELNRNFILFFMRHLCVAYLFLPSLIKNKQNDGLAYAPNKIPVSYTQPITGFKITDMFYFKLRHNHKANRHTCLFTNK
jgi:hypothetical protein